MTEKEFEKFFEETREKEPGLQGFQANDPTHWKLFGHKSTLQRIKKLLKYSRLKVWFHPNFFYLSKKK